MESWGERGEAMKKSLLQGYKEKLFAEKDLTKAIDAHSSPFAKAFLEGINKQSSVVDRGITSEPRTIIRARFLLAW